MLVVVAQVVLAELARHIALRLEQFGDGDVFRLQTFLRARQSYLEQTGAVRSLTGDEQERPAVQLCWPYESVNIAPSLMMRSMLGVL